MFKIRTFDNISPKGLELLPRGGFEVSTEFERPDGILVRSSKLHELAFAPNLAAIARAGVGVDNVPVERCTKSGIAVFNTPGANANAVCELVIAALLLTSRRLVQGMQFTQSLAGSDGDIVKLAEKGKKDYGGNELAGRTLGVIGLGAIGGRIVNAARGLGMNVIGFDPWLSVENALQLPRDLHRTQYIQELYSLSDYITVHVPLFDNTKNLINRESLKQCKTGVRVLNFSRDGIIDNPSIIEAIKAGKVASYATDFTRPELLGHDKIMCFPHLGASTAEAEENCALMACQQLRNYLEHGNVANSVNYPNVTVPRSTPYRLSLFTENVPNMVGQISSLLGTHSINIAELVNKSLGDVAYNIIDLDSPCGDDVLESLRGTEGIISVRFIKSGS